MFPRPRSAWLTLVGCFGLTLFAFAAEEPAPADPGVQMAPFQVSDSSLEIGAQLNPFVNTLTKRLKYINTSRVKAGSVAERAGLRNGDRIVEINGLRLSDYKIADFPDLKLPTVNRRVSVALKVERKGMKAPVDVTLVFDDFVGHFNFSIRKSTPQKKPAPAP